MLHREYDVSMDTDEPQQVLSFIPNRKTRGAYTVDDESSQEVVSFTIGKGKADWGPLTIYALMRSGDVWAMSPFMPSNASVHLAFS
jgi:nucleoporin NUP82